jgi:hypothetical protein
MGICVLLLFYLLSLMCHESMEMQIFFVFKLVSWVLFYCGCDDMYSTISNFTAFDGN